MKTLTEFAAGLEMGFLTDTTIHELIAIDRLCPVLVRCGNVRFVAGAQYIPDLVAMVEASGDYVRDVSLPVGSNSRAIMRDALLRIVACPEAEYVHEIAKSAIFRAGEAGL